ncbi:hypothetical protein C2R22_24580 (plasmid) [Salinigranum rubrum]|uniref:Uncharacterized protein n=1 Tax=Salinigranum rubrum TaxID=755307 RepID=A0A2I8VS07_9EURY|nr:hypothetical protein [Salinigranum rubrum]AUV84708.1 hypothetical protein C2R22_24580 [Salinigranum rubrum]
MTRLSRRAVLAGAVGVATSLAGCSTMDSDDEATSTETPEPDGAYDITRVVVPRRVEAGDSVSVTLFIRETSAERYITANPPIRFYHVQDERRLQQVPMIHLDPGEYRLWEMDFLTGVPLQNEPPVTEHPGTLLVDVDGHVETVEVVR